MLGAVCPLVAAGAVAGCRWLVIVVFQTREKVPHMGPILWRRVRWRMRRVPSATGALLTGWCAAILGYHVAMVSVRGFSVVFGRFLLIVWAVLPC